MDCQFGVGRLLDFGHQGRHRGGLLLVQDFLLDVEADLIEREARVGRRHDPEAADASPAGGGFDPRADFAFLE